MERITVLPVIVSLVVALFATQQPTGFRDLEKTCAHAPMRSSDSSDVALPNVGPATMIPEYHDCQSLIVGGKFETLAGVYATQQDRTDDGAPNLLAIVLNYEKDYAPLGLHVGVSCLYAEVKNDGRAWMKFNGDDLNCRPRLRSTSDGSTKQLIVRRSTDKDYTNPRDYPRVARWDWSDKGSQQYIGVECSTERIGAWCEIGDRSFLPSKLPDFKDADGKPLLGDSRVYRIKAWFDVQRLAIQGEGGLIPGKEIGYLFPAPNLDAMQATEILRLDGDAGRNQAAITKLRGKLLATATISGESSTYRVKYAMEPGRATQILFGAPEYAGETSEATRYSRGVTIGGKPYDVIRRAHPAGSPHIRGTVRWRWSTRDETGWIACVEGCCEIVN